MYKAEEILKSDYTRRFLVMFFVVEFILHVFKLPLWGVIPAVVILPVLWEVFWKWKRKTPVEIWDVIFSFAGGIAAILLHR